MAATFFGDARMPATDDANAAATTATLTPPASMATDDYVVVVVVNDQISQTISISNAGGQTWTSETKQQQNSSTLQIFHCRFNGTWSANPAWSWTTSSPYVVWMTVFRGIDTTTALDVAVAYAAQAAPATPFDVTIAANSLTTVTDGAMIVAIWYANDNNTHALQTAGWTNPNAQAQWRNSGGTDCSLAIGYKVQATAGGNEATVDRQLTLGGDSGQSAILALRPAGGGGGGSTGILTRATHMVGGAF